jgi:EAL domain-containing protein (putative c-di-GMP-specific phosphodiesterase class I)
MHLQAIAGHVSTEPTRQLLREFGADYGQGYLLGEPLALALPGRRPAS